MTRLPDVRASLYYVGYDAVHDSRLNDPMDPERLTRQQDEYTWGSRYCTKVRSTVPPP
jgi:hypothetical protein